MGKHAPIQDRCLLGAYCLTLLVMYLISVLHHLANGCGWGCTMVVTFFRLDTSSVFVLIIGSWLPPALAFRDKRWMRPVLILVIGIGIFGIVTNFINQQWVWYTRIPLYLTM